MNAKEIYEAACHLLDADRSHFIDCECGSDAILRVEVERLFKENAAVTTSRVVERESSKATRPYALPTEPDVTRQGDHALTPGESVGAYQVKRQLGKGGMGSVWLAEQSEPVKRTVAIKVIKDGVGLRDILIRFEAERQALAMMNHPHIARILDAGSTPGGQPFFAMELVDGSALTTYCDDHKLTVAERLDLFVNVCAGVHHAHQKGIIHRDLKPSNILVTSVDGKPVPKVIDFGLAKALQDSDRLTSESLSTGAGQILGTLKYMSPEQASLDIVDIDTRTDIFSLGVILYELLTGSTPIDNKVIAEISLLGVLELIRKKDPLRPSRYLDSTNARQAPPNRRMGVEKLKRLLRGELDWIVCKALEKDRESRYETVSDLAADIKRFQINDIVLARPPSLGYRLRKFGRKHRGGMLVAGMFGLAVLVGFAGTTWGMFQAIRAEEAESARADSEKVAKEKAEKRLVQIEKGNDILTSVFAELDIRKVRAEGEQLESVLAHKLLDAADELQVSAIGDPMIEGRTRVQLARSLVNLGYPIKAMPLFQKALATLEDSFGSDHPYVFIALSDMARAHRAAGNYQTALETCRKVLELSRQKLGEEDKGTVFRLYDLALIYQDLGEFRKAIDLMEQALELHRKVLGEQARETWIVMVGLAQSHMDVGSPVKAIDLLEVAVERMSDKLGEHHLDTISTRNTLAQSYELTGDTDRALPLFRKCLEGLRGMDDSHPESIRTLNNLANCHRSRREYSLATPLFEEAMRLALQRFGKEHPSALAVMSSTALNYLSCGQREQGIELMKETLQIRRKKLGPEHPQTLTSLNNLALAYLDGEKPGLAVPLFTETLRVRQAELGKDHPSTLITMNNLAGAQLRVGDKEKALSLMEQVVELKEQKQGRKHPSTQKSIANLGLIYLRLNRPSAAIAMFEEAAQVKRSGIAPDVLTAALRSAYLAAKDSERLNAWVNDRLSDQRVDLPANSLALAIALARHGRDLLSLGCNPEAEKLLEECVRIRMEKEPTAWTSSLAQSMLGATLIGQKRFEEARPLLMNGYEGLKVNESTIPDQVKDVYLNEALHWLIAVCEGLNQSDQAEKWRKELELRSQSSLESR